MEEARRVLARLERIQTLDRGGARPGVVLGEVRALLTEVEAWVRTERDLPEAASDAVERCRKALESASRTLVA